MTYKNFEDYLKDKHAEQYHGLDDEMPDAFDSWLGTLDGEDYITYANAYGIIQNTKGYKAGLEDK